MTALAVLALGFVASAVAVVPGLGGLLDGNRAYLAVTSGLGLLALLMHLRCLSRRLPDRGGLPVAAECGPAI